jgi:acetyl-CoA C-acetyltransferase
MATRETVLCTPLRTAISTFGGSFKSVPATKLGATVARAVLSRAKLEPAKIATVVMGNVIEAGNKMNPARQAAVEAFPSRSRR